MTKEELIQAISDDKIMPFIQPEQLAGIVDFVIKNYEPSCPSDLDEAARHYLLNEHCSPLNEIMHQADIKAEMTYHKDIESAFKGGAGWLLGQGVSLSHLIAWYIQSVDAHEPIWTKEHLEELVKDYILIPKN